MNIAFLSYEFPMETGGGGIGTYLLQITKMISENGHRSTVFAGTNKKEPFWESPGVFRIPASGWVEFNEQVSQYFIPIHNESAFDVVECTDFHGCGLNLKKRLPELPIVVRLHTPLYMVDKLLFQPLSAIQKLRFKLGSLRRGKWILPPQGPAKRNYQQEFEIIELAEKVNSPSTSIYNEMKNLGFKLEGKTQIVPLPFAIPADYSLIKSRLIIKNNPRIVFIGRLEFRKGVIELARAIPLVLQMYPRATFTFIGESSNSPRHNLTMTEYLYKKVKKNLDSVTFTGKVSGHEILKFLTFGDIFVFPSHYESFGLACVEAMSAGKAVIGSNAGGMAEIIEDGRSGLLVNPKDYRSLASCINSLIENDGIRISVGDEGKKRIQEYLNPRVILKKQMQVYQNAMDSVHTNSMIDTQLTS